MYHCLLHVTHDDKRFSLLSNSFIEGCYGHLPYIRHENGGCITMFHDFISLKYNFKFCKCL